MAPIFDYGRADGNSVTLGHVYRGAAIPDLDGRLVFGDFSRQTEFPECRCKVSHASVGDPFEDRFHLGVTRRRTQFTVHVVRQLFAREVSKKRTQAFAWVVDLTQGHAEISTVVFFPAAQGLFEQ